MIKHFRRIQQQHLLQKNIHTHIALKRLGASQPVCRAVRPHWATPHRASAEALFIAHKYRTTLYTQTRVYSYYYNVLAVLSIHKHENPRVSCVYVCTQEAHSSWCHHTAHVVWRRTEKPARTHVQTDASVNNRVARSSARRLLFTSRVERRWERVCLRDRHHNDTLCAANARARHNAPFRAAEKTRGPSAKAFVKCECGVWCLGRTVCGFCAEVRMKCEVAAYRFLNIQMIYVRRVDREIEVMESRVSTIL